MQSALYAELAALRDTILQLKPTGADGFEGFLAVVLGKISGQDFRLAKSGTQHGKDGETLPSANRIAFEGKLYDTNLSDVDVLAKIAQVIASSNPPDVWILGATVGVSTQLVDTAHAAANKGGVGILILDWPPTSQLPPLAVACALASKEAIAFLRTHVRDSVSVERSEAALSTICLSDLLKSHSEGLSSQLLEPTLGLTNARVANEAWLMGIFSDRALARGTLGQALTPNAPGIIPLRARDALIQAVQHHLVAPPSRKVIALIGGEGRGKSWLVARSWLALAERPLMIIVPASDLKPGAPLEPFTSFLASRVIQQTNDSNSARAYGRWNRRLASWADHPTHGSPRFILCVDGLNQQPGFDWPRWLDHAASAVEQLGGVLVITTREAYFNERIRTALHSKVERIVVPEWTPTELQEILAAKEIDPSSVKAGVLERLRNPRILGVAFELLDALRIQSFAELSVERLLFEHIRASSRDATPGETSVEFSKRLAQHAHQIIDRVKRQELDDRLVFSRATEREGKHELTAQLQAVTSEHFFHAITGDPTLYTLSEDGLSLALGLSIISALQRAERNQKDVKAALDEIVEPIAALDKTADAVFAGMLVASIDDASSPVLRRTLISAYLRLQNIDPRNYPAFVAVARNATDAAMLALLDVSQSSSYTANRDWLSSALRECRASKDCWSVISAHITNWLRSYSLDPTLGLIRTPAHHPIDKVEQELTRKTALLESKLARLSLAERTFLGERMLRDDKLDATSLMEDAFALLAGMPLAEHAEALVASRFSYALNSNPRASYDEYLALIRFNRRDWPQTRAALLTSSSFLRGADVSQTGRWALVAVLRATATLEDAEHEDGLVEVLTADWEKGVGSRLAEKYCATDPCDPLSARPDNIDDTAQCYSAIDAEAVAKHRTMGSADRLIRDARPGLARFIPETAIAVQRKVADSIVRRLPRESMLAIISLEQHSAVLQAPVVDKLLSIGCDLSSPRHAEQDDSGDDWVTSQYAIVIAFPHLDGNAQLDFLISLPPHGPPLRKLTEVLKPADPVRLEQALDLLAESNDYAKQLAILAFVSFSGTLLTEGAYEAITRLAQNENAAIRAEAMHIIAQEKEAESIRSIVATGWSAATLDPRKHNFEAWYGSWVMITAAEMNMLTGEELVDRMSPRLWGAAATILGEGVYQPIATRLRTAIEKALDAALPFLPPAVEQRVDGVGLSNPPRHGLVEPDKTANLERLSGRESETPEEFQEWQRQGWASFERFEAELTKEHARLILEDVGAGAVEALVSTSPAKATELAVVFINLSDAKLYHIQNLALTLAQYLSRRDPATASSLFERLAGRRAVVNLVYGPSAVSHEAICIWDSADNPELDRLRTGRLDGASTDYQLAQEVMAALITGKASHLQRYAHRNLASAEPAVTARGLMVLGFGLESPEADGQLVHYDNARGFIGKAAAAARFAYNRNRWAEHWFRKMCTTDSSEEFWLFSALFLKIVDARFMVWNTDIARTGAPAKAFEPSIRSQAENRINAWKSKREKTLCGDKAPTDIFLV
jgi:hypothetical protein